MRLSKKKKKWEHILYQCSALAHRVSFLLQISCSCQSGCLFAHADRGSWSICILISVTPGPCKSSWEKPGQVGILTHTEAKWIILILLKGFCSAYSSSELHCSSAIQQHIHVDHLCLFPMWKKPWWRGGRGHHHTPAKTITMSMEAAKCAACTLPRREVTLITDNGGVICIQLHRQKRQTQRQRPLAALYVGVHVSSLLSLIQLSCYWARRPDDSVWSSQRGFIEQ